ncbi:MAG TPA: DUF5655 domain-containing protein [Candidatus Limnocylindrales bacterium]|nr:DUF5655 domain-containing protein [Candidatus Limnocylindrales bacterium]
MDLDGFFAGRPFARAVHDRVAALIAAIGPAEARVTKSQVSFRRRRGFAYVWIPGRYLAHPAAEVVLSVALPRHIRSPRWKEVVRPAATTWMHHLEVRSLDELDPEVAGWLREAYAAAG